MKSYVQTTFTYTKTNLEFKVKLRRSILRSKFGSTGREIFCLLFLLDNESVNFNLHNSQGISQEGDVMGGSNGNNISRDRLTVTRTKSLVLRRSLAGPPVHLLYTIAYYAW